MYYAASLGKGLNRMVLRPRIHNLL
jgi:hypothetical protein